MTDGVGVNGVNVVNNGGDFKSFVMFGMERFQIFNFQTCLIF